MGIDCPVCGAENPDGAQFCGSCGRTLSQLELLGIPGVVVSGRRFGRGWFVVAAIVVVFAVVGGWLFASGRAAKPSVDVGGLRVVSVAGGVPVAGVSVGVLDPAGVPVGPVGSLAVGDAFLVEAPDAGLGGLVVVEVPFDPSVVPEGGEGEVFAAVFVDELNGWFPASGVVDWDAGVVRVETDHLSIFRVFVNLFVPTAFAPGPSGGGVGSATYVGLGDSYSSGEGVPPFEDGTAEPRVNECHRSELAYPLLVAKSRGVDVVSRACSGATVSNLVTEARWGATPDPQVDWLSDDTQLVTVTIGGNDIRFAEVIADCFWRSCVDNYRSDRGDVVTDRIAALEPELVAAFERMVSSAKQATVVVLGYPDLFPEPLDTILDTDGENAELTPVVGGVCLDHFSSEERTWIRHKTNELNTVIARAAGHVQSVTYVDTIRADEGNGFAGHELCTDHPWFNGVIVRPKLDRSPVTFVYSFHPNAEGQQTLANLVDQHLNRLDAIAVTTPTTTGATTTTAPNSASCELDDLVLAEDGRQTADRVTVIRGCEATEFSIGVPFGGAFSDLEGGVVFQYDQSAILRLRPREDAPEVLVSASDNQFLTLQDVALVDGRLSLVYTRYWFLTASGEAEQWLWVSDTDGLGERSVARISDYGSANRISYGGGMFAVDWENSIENEAGIVFLDTDGGLVDVPANPTPGQGYCAFRSGACALGAVVSPDGTLLAYYEEHRILNELLLVVLNLETQREELRMAIPGGLDGVFVSRISFDGQRIALSTYSCGDRCYPSPAFLLDIATGETQWMGTPGLVNLISDMQQKDQSLPREGVLYSSLATLRSEPTLDDSTEITKIRGRDGASIEILSENVDGWYLIRIDGVEGWMFGTFVYPPDPGLAIGRTVDGSVAELLDSAGRALGVENASGSKVLVVDTSGDLWEVLLPDGTAAWVDPSDVQLVR